MRLINCTTLELEEFFGDKIPRYAILSHTWLEEEVIFTDLPLTQPTTMTRAGYRKIEYTCTQARADRLNYAWVDTCCIDKRSSAELSEAINSMFAWYKNSTECYAYLSDVEQVELESTFPESRWFRRGWTLQELLAPRDVIFYDQNWNTIGSRSELADWISEIAGVDAKALSGNGLVTSIEKGALRSFCVAKKMSWASYRETTRVEDIAYCLLGIFDVTMSPLYGEGDRAFVRLQEEILRRTDDDSILAWGLEPGKVYKSVRTLNHWRDHYDRLDFPSVLASSPKDFSNCATLEYRCRSTSPVALTNVGLQIKLPLISLPSSDRRFDWMRWASCIGLLSCSANSGQDFLGIPLSASNKSDDVDVTRQVSRLRYSRIMPASTVSTVVLGPRAAMSSPQQSIIISTYGLSHTEAKNHLQIIIEESNLLRDLFYSVKKAARLNVTLPYGFPIVENSIWDPETRIFTLKHDSLDPMVDFCFETCYDQRPNFTIFLHTGSGKAVVREGSTFTHDGRLSILQYLQDKSTQAYAEKITLSDSEGNPREVGVSIKKKAIYDRLIFAVIVEAVEITNEAA